jgi:hypothetical protein
MQSASNIGEGWLATVIALYLPCRQRRPEAVARLLNRLFELLPCRTCMCPYPQPCTCTPAELSTNTGHLTRFLKGPSSRSFNPHIGRISALLRSTPARQRPSLCSTLDPPPKKTLKALTPLSTEGGSVLPLIRVRPLLYCTRSLKHLLNSVI